MATEIQLDIVTPERGVFSGKVLQVILPAWEGQEGALPDHDAKLALLRGGVCTVVTSEGETRYAIGRGFAEMGIDRVTLLCDSCEEKSAIDKAEVQSELSELRTTLLSQDWVSEAANTTKVAIELAEAKLEA